MLLRGSDSLESHSAATLTHGLCPDCLSTTAAAEGLDLG